MADSTDMSCLRNPCSFVILCPTKHHVKAIIWKLSAKKKQRQEVGLKFMIKSKVIISFSLQYANSTLGTCRLKIVFKSVFVSVIEISSVFMSLS